LISPEIEALRENADLAKGGVKFDQGKVRWDTIPVEPLNEVMRVLDYGAKKYARDNWRTGMPYGRVFSSLMRHILAWWGGEDRDPETGIHHLAHAAANCLFLLEWAKTHPELDDRAKDLIKSLDDRLPEKSWAILVLDKDRLKQGVHNDDTVIWLEQPTDKVVNAEKLEWCGRKFFLDNFATKRLRENLTLEQMMGKHTKFVSRDCYVFLPD
jgi:hypothetical protein